jgi:hypothetical protein
MKPPDWVSAHGEQLTMAGLLVVVATLVIFLAGYELVHTGSVAPSPLSETARSISVARQSRRPAN